MVGLTVDREYSLVPGKNHRDTVALGFQKLAQTVVESLKVAQDIRFVGVFTPALPLYERRVAPVGRADRKVLGVRLEVVIFKRLAQTCRHIF